MMIGYTRTIVGCKTDQLRYKLTTENACVVDFVNDLKEDSWLDVANLKGDEVKVEEFISRLWGQRTEEYTEREVTCCVRQEAMTKLFYYSSFVDAIYRLLFYMKCELKICVTVCHVVSLVMFCARDCDGQLLVNQILNGFASGRFGENPMGFPSAIQEVGCLYILCCKEALHLSLKSRVGQDRKTRASSRSRRFKSINALIWQQGGDEQKVSETITWFMGLIDRLQKGASSYQKTAKAVYQAALGAKRGFGHLVTMQALHLAALTSLVQPCYYNVAFVVENRSFGPGRFFDSHNHTADRHQTIKMQFKNMCEDLGKAGLRNIMISTLENYACAKARNVRAPEFLLFFNNRMQTVMDVIYRPNAKQEKTFQLMILVCGCWRQFSDVVRPLYWKKDNGDRKGQKSVNCENEAIMLGASKKDWTWPSGYVIKEDVLDD